MSRARASVGLSLLSLIVTLFSLANQIVIARAFGASHAFDEYLQATSIPMLVMGAFGGLAAYALVPALTRATSNTEASERATAFLLALVGVGAVIAIVGVVSAPQALHVLTRSARAPITTQAIDVARIAWASVLASTILAFATSLLNLNGRYVLALLMSSLTYATTPIAVLALGSAIGITSIAWGLAAGTFGGAIILLISTRRLLVLRGVRRAHFEPALAFFASAPLAVLSALTFSIYQSVDAYWAPQLGPSSLSVLGYCQRLLVALGTIMAAGPSVVLQPRLAAAANRGDDPAFTLDLARALRLTLLICAPVAAGISIVAAPAVRLLFERGQFDRTATFAVAGLLPWMLAGMVPLVCTVMAFKALFARHDLRTAAVLGSAGPLIYFFGSGVSVRTVGLHGIGATYVLTWLLLASVAVLRVAPQALGWLGEQRVPREVALLTSCTAGAALVGRWTVLEPWQTVSQPDLLARLLVAATLGVATYVVVGLYVLRVDDLWILVRSARRA
ncbi:MAG TPA: lipid II flippase MurJ [Gemmatimonadaceae bacterium]